MAEKGETRILITITFCVILISIGLSGCIDLNEKRWVKFEFQLSITNNIENESIILIPILDSKNLSSSDIENYYKYSNISKIYYLNHSFLQFLINESINIEYRKRFKSIEDFNKFKKQSYVFNSQYQTQENYSWDESVNDFNQSYNYLDIFTNIGNTNKIHLKYFYYYLTEGGQSREFSIDTKLHDGWNRIKYSSGTGLT